MLRVLPHNLRVMQTLPPPHAHVAVVIVILLLVDPVLHGGRRVRISLAVPPVDVLAVGSAGVDELAVSRSLLGVVFGVCLEGEVPLEGSDSDLSAGVVVGLEEVGGGVLGLAHESLGYTHQEEESQLLQAALVHLSLSISTTFS